MFLHSLAASKTDHPRVAAQQKIEKSEFADFWQNLSPLALTESAKVQHMRNDWDNTPMTYLDYAVSRGINLSRKGDHGLSLITLNALILALRIPTNIMGMIRSYRHHFAQAAQTNPAQRFPQKSNTALINALAETAFINAKAVERFEDYEKQGLSRLKEVEYTDSGKTFFRQEIEEAHTPIETSSSDTSKKARQTRSNGEIKARQKMFSRALENNPHMTVNEARQLRKNLYRTLKAPKTTAQLEVAMTDAMLQTLPEKSRRRTWSYLPSLRR